MNSNVGTKTSRIRDFSRMNHSKFHDSNVDKDPQEFVDEVHKILEIVGVTAVEKV